VPPGGINYLLTYTYIRSFLTATVATPIIRDESTLANKSFPTWYVLFDGLAMHALRSQRLRARSQTAALSKHTMVVVSLPAGSTFVSVPLNPTMALLH